MVDVWPQLEHGKDHWIDGAVALSAGSVVFDWSDFKVVQHEGALDGWRSTRGGHRTTLGDWIGLDWDVDICQGHGHVHGSRPSNQLIVQEQTQVGHLEQLGCWLTPACQTGKLPSPASSPWWGCVQQWMASQ